MSNGIERKVMNSDPQQIESWLRRPRESPEAYEAFKTYLEMGRDRSYSGVSEILGKHVSLIKRWGTTHDWIERIRIYNNWLEKQSQMRDIEAMEEFRRVILGEGAQDYESLRKLFKKGMEEMMEGEFDVHGFYKLVKARKELDTLARRAGMMPDNYRDNSTVEEKGEQPTEWVLSIDQPAEPQPYTNRLPSGESNGTN